MKILVACHGEAAIRLLSNFTRSGVQTVTVYTQEDWNSKHIQFADEGICIGDTLKSYHTDWHRIITAAEIVDADAIHLGDSPLSTHPQFAQACRQSGLRLITDPDPGDRHTGDQPTQSP